MLFTGGSALSQDEGEGWYACAEVGTDSPAPPAPPPGGNKIFSRH